MIEWLSLFFLGFILVVIPGGLILRKYMKNKEKELDLML